METIIMAGTPIWSYSIFGMPIWAIAIIGLVIFVIYLLLTRNKEPKQFKELDLKKETKKRLNKEYKYFGEFMGKFLFDANSIDNPNDSNKIGYVIGFMKMVWFERFKRYEPIMKSFDKQKLWEKMALSSKEVYQKEYKDLDDAQKKNITELAKEELREEQTDIIKVGEKSKIVKGKKEIIDNIPIPTYCFKICGAGFFRRMLGVFLGIGIHYFIFDANQVSIEANKIILIAHFSRKVFQDQFIFSKAGKELLQDIAFVVDRESQLQAIANETSKVTFFDTGLGANIEKVREAYKLEAEKHKVQSETHNLS